MARFLMTICLLISTNPAFAYAAELRASIQSSQLEGQERSDNACYQAADSMKADSDNFRVETEILPKKNQHDHDAIYKIYSSQESTCVVLENNGANDYDFGLGANRLLGCNCSLSMKIR